MVEKWQSQKLLVAIVSECFETYFKMKIFDFLVHRRYFCNAKNSSGLRAWPTKRGAFNLF